MPRVVAILDDTTESQKLGLALMGAIGSFVSAVGFTTVDELPAVAQARTVYCPLTLNLPPTFEFWGRSIWQICRDLDRSRAIAAKIGFNLTDRGDLYLPIIWRDRTPTYADIISEGADGSYATAVTIESASLAASSERLLREIDAPPAVYLVRFSHANADIAFDRLFPFPAPPALASVGKQPDLFERYWRCISQS